MNGLTGSLRTARPVRLALAARLGGDIDGSWWPYSNSVAQELPGLIGCLHDTLGEIIDVCINWPVTEGPLELETMVIGTRRPTPKSRRLRLMFIEGQKGSAKLLVIPHMTSAELGTLVMRYAAGRPVLEYEPEDRMVQTAELILRTAQVESANWAARMRQVATTAEP